MNTASSSASPSLPSSKRSRPWQIRVPLTERWVVVNKPKPFAPSPPAPVGALAIAQAAAARADIGPKRRRRYQRRIERLIAAGARVPA